MSQDRDEDDWQTATASQSQEAPAENRAGLVADSTVGRAGQRQIRDQFEGIEPMARIGNRFTSRVQNRIPNRIGRDYDPNRITTSPFAVAADQLKSANPRTRR